MIRPLLARAGAHLPARTILRADNCINYLAAGQFMRAHRLEPSLVASREEVFAAAARRIAKSRALYLEFGVYRGHSMRWWAQALENDGSELVGFDSFEGLSEEWHSEAKQGSFSTDGNIPEIEDKRVMFLKGWFSDTVPRFVETHSSVFKYFEQIFVTLDADLYSSTKFVLEQLGPHLTVGTLLYFDEFQDRHHEMKAWREWLQTSKWGIQAVAATRDLAHVTFERVA